VHTILPYHVGRRVYVCIALNGGSAFDDHNNVLSLVDFIAYRRFLFRSTLEFGQGILSSTDQQMQRDDASQNILSSPS
jgi:hypothetical protein